VTGPYRLVYTLVAKPILGKWREEGVRQNEKGQGQKRRHGFLRSKTFQGQRSISEELYRPPGKDEQRRYFVKRRSE